MADEQICGAQAWRTFTLEGVISTRVFETARVTCGKPKGHPDDHVGRLAFKTGARDLWAMVIW